MNPGILADLFADWIGAELRVIAEYSTDSTTDLIELHDKAQDRARELGIDLANCEPYRTVRGYVEERKEWDTHDA